MPAELIQTPNLIQPKLISLKIVDLGQRYENTAETWQTLLQIGILHFKHLYFVVLKHELHLSASLELVTESFARQAAMLFFSSTLFYACFEGKLLEKYIIIAYAFDSAHVKYSV